jgi:putative glutamine amidotransferase
MQVLNVALGGTLITDIPSLYPTELEHNTPEAGGRDAIAHSVTLTSDSILAQVYGNPSISVNSFHHQAIDKLAPGLEVTGRASDGLMEAVECASAQFNTVGVQWHPECLLSRSDHKNLFKAFVSACKVNGQE